MLSKEHYVNECLKALTDPTRLRIVELLTNEGEKNRMEIIQHLAAQGLDIVPMTVTHHMNKLMNTGVVILRSEKNYKYWSIAADMKGIVSDVLALRGKLDRHFTGKTFS